MKAKLNLLLVAALAIGLFSGLALAADPPPGDSAGPQSQRLQQELKQKQGDVGWKAPTAPKVEIPKEEEKPVAAGISFMLKDVMVKGSTIFKPQDFKPLYASMIGTKVSLADLEKVVNKIKEMYQKRGYLTTIVYVPDQDIQEGRITIKIAEGKLGKLNIEKSRWFSEKLIRKYFHSKENQILDINELIKDVLRINQNPDLDVRTVIVAGKEPSTSDITVQISESRPHHAQAIADNRGTLLTGKYREMLYLYSNNATGNLDQIFVNTIYSTNSFGESGSYVLPIGTLGSKFGLDIAYFHSILGGEYKASKIIGVTELLTPKFIKELYLSESMQADVEIGLEVKSVKKHNAGAITTNDQLRLPYLALDLSATDTMRGQSSFNPQITFGTSSFLGASHRNHPTSSRAGTGGSYFEYSHTFQRVQGLPLESYLVINHQLQLASHTLASSEQLQLGGMGSVRGYPEGDYLCDEGGTLNIDWVMPFYLIPKDWKLPHADTPLRKQLQPVLFFDIGGGRLKKVNAGEQRQKTLIGVGGGFKFYYNRYLSVVLEWARHVGDEPSGGQGNSSFNMSFQAGF